MERTQKMSARKSKLDSEQRRPLKTPSGDIRLEPGWVLRPIIGYSVKEIPAVKAIMNETTRKGIKLSKGWLHEASHFMVTATLDETPHFGTLLHVAMSYPDHDPSWPEIKLVRAAFFPKEIDVIMVLPKEGDYVNVHPHCFHLWQAPEAWDMI